MKAHVWILHIQAVTGTLDVNKVRSSGGESLLVTQLGLVSSQTSKK
jgi:hypothetical protein